MSVESIDMLGAFHEARADVHNGFRLSFAFPREKMLLSAIS
jgi:DNA-binding transcriptional MocR family regulator